MSSRGSAPGLPLWPRIIFVKLHSVFLSSHLATLRRIAIYNNLATDIYSTIRNSPTYTGLRKECIVWCRFTAGEDIRVITFQSTRYVFDGKLSVILLSLDRHDRAEKWKYSNKSGLDYNFINSILELSGLITKFLCSYAFQNPVPGHAWKHGDVLNLQNAFYYLRTPWWKERLKSKPTEVHTCTDGTFPVLIY